MAAGLRALGPVRELAAGRLLPRRQRDAPQVDVFQLPLWGNPLLQLEFSKGQRTVDWPEGAGLPDSMWAERAAWLAAVAKEQEGGFAGWVGTPGLHTVGDLRRLVTVLLKVHNEQKWAWSWLQRTNDVKRAVWGTQRVRLPTRVQALLRLWPPGGEVHSNQMLVAAQAMLHVLPVEWQDAVRVRMLAERAAAGLDRHRQQLDVAATDSMVRLVVARLGWGGFSLTSKLESREGKPLWPLTVRAGTRLQLGPAFAAQRQARVRLAREALVQGVQALPQEQEVLQAAWGLEAGMRRVWQVKWENRPKEALWRMAAQGIPGAGGHGICQAGPCPCGWAAATGRRRTGGGVGVANTPLLGMPCGTGGGWAAQRRGDRPGVDVCTCVAAEGATRCEPHCVGYSMHRGYRGHVVRQEGVVGRSTWGNHRLILSKHS
jgi:hypothetical protein